jgi:hypothetical protein
MEKIEMEKQIKQGLESLIEKRLKNLETAVDKNEPQIYEQVDLCLDVERIAIQEGLNIDEYSERRSKLTKNYLQHQTMERMK